jgi:hypothetical protein
VTVPNGTVECNIFVFNEKGLVAYGAALERVDRLHGTECGTRGTVMDSGSREAVVARARTRNGSSAGGPEKCGLFACASLGVRLLF